jgi:molybdopterin synthase catalytic subunit
MKTVKQNITVTGKSISFGVAISRYENTGAKYGLSKTFSGAVKTPKKGNSAPMLNTSANEATVDNITRAT